MGQVGVEYWVLFPVTGAGNRYVLVSVDYFTKLPEAYASPDQGTTTTANKLVEEMFCRFGAAEELNSDQWRNSDAKVFNKVYEKLARQGPPPFTPKAMGLLNGLIRLWRYSWPLSHPTTRRTVTDICHWYCGCIPAALMFGTELHTPVDLFLGRPLGPEVPGAAGLEHFHHQ